MLVGALILFSGIFIVGFVAGFGAREAISRRKRRRNTHPVLVGGLRRFPPASQSLAPNLVGGEAD
jgi:hypothetical protein